MEDKFLIKQRIKELRNIIYNTYSNVGGHLHVVLDDGNIEEDHIRWCLNECINSIADDKERGIYTECAELLLKLSYSSRKRLLREL